MSQQPYIPDTLPLSNLDYRLLLPLVGQANAASARYDRLLLRSMQGNLRCLKSQEQPQWNLWSVDCISGSAKPFVEPTGSTISCPATNHARRCQYA